MRPSGPADDEQVAGGNVCSHCGRTFASPNGLSIHIGRAHDGKSKPAAKAKRKPGKRAPKTPATDTYACSDCELSFDSPQKRGAHRRRQHPNPLAVVPEPVVPSMLAEVPFERREFDPDTVREQQAAAMR